MYIEIDLVNIAKEKVLFDIAPSLYNNKNILFLHIVITYIHIMYTYIIRYEKFANIFKGAIS